MTVEDEEHLLLQIGRGPRLKANATYANEDENNKVTSAPSPRSYSGVRFAMVLR